MERIAHVFPSKGTSLSIVNQCTPRLFYVHVPDVHKQYCTLVRLRTCLDFVYKELKSPPQYPETVRYILDLNKIAMLVLIRNVIYLKLTIVICTIS